MTANKLNALSSSAFAHSETLTDHLRMVHGVISSRYPAIDRVALITYDASTDALKTFVSSNLDDALLTHYETPLSQVPSLAQLASQRQSRIIDDIHATLTANSTHTAWLKSRDYRSSFTLPIYRGEQLAGFLFFDSKLPQAFDADTASFLEVFANLIAQLYLLQLQVVHNMVGTVHLASGLARLRDLETGQHLERMASYTRLMARELATSHGFTDEFIEYVFLFAPLHDIGKVGIPDIVLLKPGKLDAQEWVIMKRHVEIGEAIIDQMDLGMSGGSKLANTVMRNIVAAHHERGDGSGYPRGLLMAQIPMEARMVAVADVYDALSNRRPYKAPWTEEAIAAELQKEVALGRLDKECVDVLWAAQSERLAIQTRHADEPPATLSNQTGL